MNNYIKLPFFIIVCFFFFISSTDSSGSLTIQIENINKSKGVIWIGIYDSADDFLIKERSILKKITINHTGTAKIMIPKLPYGEYAIALFHDINENGEMDSDFWGIPTEPFAFSGHIESKWRVPHYNEVKFYFWQRNNALKLKLKEWSIF